MSDEADNANELADLHLKAAIDNQRAPVTRLRYVGRCHNCDEPLEEGLFCDASCADDHAQRERFKK